MRRSAAYGALAVVAAAAAYWMVFTTFAAYDDEGTVLTSLLLFKQGQPLYGDVVTQYGPFYFEVYGGLSVLTGRELTHDIGRLLVVAEWTATSVLVGIACERLSGSLLLGLAGMASTFSVLSVLTAEPMHPVGLTVLLLAVTLLALIALTGRRATAGAMLLGFALGGLTMTKINVGVFALAALALAMAAAWPPLAARRTLAWLVAAGFLAMPFVLMASDLGNAAVRDFLFVTLGAGGALVVAAYASRERPEAVDTGLSRWLGVAAVAFVVTVAASLIAIVAAGSSPADVYDGMVVEARRTRDALLSPLEVPRAGAWWSVAALAGAVVAVRVSGSARPAIWPALGRILVGLGMWLTVAKSAPVDLGPSSSGLEPAMALAWVAAVPPAGVEERIVRFARVALPALALAESLQVYPIAGTQVGAAKLIFVLVGALCLGDGLHQLRAWSAGGGRRLEAVAPVAALALAAVLTWTLMVQPGITAAVRYADGTPLPLHGAQRIHLPVGDVDTYTRLVGLLREHCTAFAGYPSVSSLYLWSGIDPPRGGLPGPWMYLLTDERQRRVLAELQRAERPCALRNRQLEFFWLRGRPVPNTPLVRDIVEDYRPAEEVNGYQLLVPK